VVSDKMDKTVVVAVGSLIRHPLYGRTMRRTTRFKAHDEANDAHVGDTVEITECRPISRDKKFRVSRILQRAK
jgi:small subunit ribosomal protein S17